MITVADASFPTAWDFARLSASLGPGRALRGLDYVRCVEFPLVYRHLDPVPGMRLLDAGSRTSVFPLFVARRLHARVTAVDLDPRVADLERLAARTPLTGTLTTRVADLRRLPFPDASFDRVTAISTIEHVPDTGDSDAIRELARVLAPGGRLLLTVPYGTEPRDFYVDDAIYPTTAPGERPFFQRHYSDRTLAERLLGPSGLTERERVYFGEAGTPFFNRFWVLPKLLRPFKASYAWLSPLLAARFLATFPSPDRLTLQAPPMITANGVFVALVKGR